MQVTSTAYRGMVHGGVVVLDEKSPLTDGTEVVVTPVAVARGSGAAIIAALEKAPKVPADWVDELERLIAEGRRSPAPPASFADELGSPEND